MQTLRMSSFEHSSSKCSGPLGRHDQQCTGDALKVNVYNILFFLFFSPLLFGYFSSLPLLSSLSTLQHRRDEGRQWEGRCGWREGAVQGGTWGSVEVEAALSRRSKGDGAHGPHPHRLREGGYFGAGSMREYGFSSGASLWLAWS